MEQLRQKQSKEMRDYKQQLESEKSRIYLLENFTHQMIDNKFKDFRIDMLQTRLN